MALTIALSTDFSKARSVTIASGSGVIGVSITDPVSGVVTSTTVTWATSDQATAVALAAAMNAEAAYNSYITAGTPSGGVFTVTYSGPVGLACPFAAAGGGTGLSVSGATLGIYASGQKVTVTVPVVSTESSDLSITAVDNLTGLDGIVDNSTGLVGETVTANATTTFTFAAYIRSGQSDHLDIALDYRVLCGSTVATTTTCTATIGPPYLPGGAFPNDS